MTDLLSKISRGLEARANRSSLFDGASALIISTASIQNIRDLNDAAVARHAKIIGDVEKVLADFDAAAKERIAEFRSQTKARISNDGTRVVQEARTPGELAEFREQLKIERRDVANNAVATMRPVLDELTREIEATVKAVRKSTPLLSALAIADSFDFGSEKMQRLIAQCERLQPQALKNLALRALAGEGDRHLVAAIATVNSARPSDRQEFSSADLVRNSPFAEMSRTALVHAEHVEMTGRHTLNARERLLLGRGDGSVDKIENALFGDEPDAA